MRPASSRRFREQKPQTQHPAPVEHGTSAELIASKTTKRRDRAFAREWGSHSHRKPNGRVLVEGYPLLKIPSFFMIFSGKPGFLGKIPPILVEGRQDTLNKAGIWSRGYLLFLGFERKPERRPLFLFGGPLNKKLTQNKFRESWAHQPQSFGPLEVRGSVDQLGPLQVQMCSPSRHPW